MKTLYINNTDLTRDKPVTYLSENVSLAGTTIRIQSIAGFTSVSTSSGQIVCVGEIGGERTELSRTTNASADGYPSSTYKEIALRDALKFDHPQDTPVWIVDFNRVEAQWAASVNGTKATLFTYPLQIRPDQAEMSLIDSSAIAGYYFVRFNESIGNSNSDWSDPIPYGGFDDNSVFMIKKRAVEELGEEIDGKTITHEFLNQCLWEARREYHQSRGKRPFRRNFNKVIGTALTGSFRVELPTDCERPQTSENVYGVRVGTNQNMSYYDKKEWDFDWLNKPRSYLTTPYVYGLSTSIWLANGRDFGASAVINVEGISVSVTRYEGSLTGNSLYNSLRIHTHPTGGYSASSGSDAYENVSYGLPTRFTVFSDPAGSAWIYFNRPIDTAYVNMNIYADYYRTILGYDSDADILDEPKYDLFVHYLKAKIKARKTRGENDITQDPDYKLFIFKKEKALADEVLQTDIHIEPDVSGYPIPE